MRNKTMNKIVLVLILCVAVATLLVGCSHRELDMPLLTFVADKGLVNWDAVPNATTYSVVLDGTKETIVSEPHYKLPQKGKHTVSVTALPAEGSKWRPSRLATIDVTYSTQIALPDVVLSRHMNGSIKYIINNYDTDAQCYRMTIDDKVYEVKGERGIIETGLADGEYTVSVQGIGDNLVSRDSGVVTRKVNIKPVTVHKATYETKTTQNDFYHTLDTVGGTIKYVVANLYIIDSTSYYYDKSNGSMRINENILLTHASDRPCLIEVYFDDDTIEMIEIAIKDNRLVELDEYVSVYAGNDAKIDFNIYKNDLVGVELVRTDDTKIVLTEGKEYSITRNALKAIVKINTPNKTTDKAVVLKFKKDENTYEKVVKFYFKDSLAVVDDSHVTYNLASPSRADVAIRFNASANQVTKVTLREAVEGRDYTIDNKAGIIRVSKTYLDAFSHGAVITGRAYFGSDYSTFVIHIIDNADTNFVMATLDKAEYLYKADSGIDVVMTVSNAVKVSAVSFDGIKMTHGFSYTKRGERAELNIASSFLDLLGAGRHEVRLHVDDKDTYDIVGHVVIDLDDITPKNIITSIDNTYPNIAISYRSAGDDVSTYLTNIRTGKKFESAGAECTIYVNVSELLDGDQFTVTNTRGTESKTTVPITFHMPNIAGHEKYYNAHFTYGGSEYDAVLSSEKEFETFLHYALLRVSKIRAYDEAGIVTDANDTMMWSKAEGEFEYKVKVYTEFVEFDSNTYVATMTKIIKKYGETYKEPTKFDFKITGDRLTPNECEISFRVMSTNVPYVGDEVEHPVKASRYKLGYESEYKTKNPRPHSYDDFAINKWTKTQSAFLTDDLYYAIEDGARPVPVKGSPAEHMLETIKGVMRSICDDSMSDAEKYMAIFDWIVHNVTYDGNTAIYEGNLSGNDYYKVYPRRCFYLEGVFEDNIAVCNGLAKAVVVMAGLEGIHSMKVLGYTGGNGVFPKGQRHAWIKVNLDGVWYNSDPTWGSQKWNDMPRLGELDAEGINHLNTLMSDKPFGQGNAHFADARFGNIVSNIDIDYFASMILGSTDGDIHTLDIDTKADVTAAVETVRLKAKTVSIGNRVAIPYVGGYVNMIDDMIVELARVTSLEWKASERLVSSKYGKQYTLVIFERTK